MWSLVIHEVWRFLLSIYYFPSVLYPTEKDFNKVQTKRSSQPKKEKRESNTVRKSESSTGLKRSDRWSSTGGSSGRQRRQGKPRILSEI